MLTKDEVTLEEVLELADFKRDSDGKLRITTVRDNVWGDVEGDVEGNVEGSILGSVLNSVLGDVLGDVWGTVKGDVLENK